VGSCGDVFKPARRVERRSTQLPRELSEAWTVHTTGEIFQALQVLKELPMRTLFKRIAASLAPNQVLRRIVAVVATHGDRWRPDRCSRFRRQSERVRKYGGGMRRPFPQVHTVGSGECGTHGVVAAALGISTMVAEAGSQVARRRSSPGCWAR
jgi:hypothetical protein